MRYVVTIASTDNAAFEEAGDPALEVARILEELAHNLQRDPSRLERGTTLLDANGNACGWAAPEGPQD